MSNCEISESESEKICENGALQDPTQSKNLNNLKISENKFNLNSDENKLKRSSIEQSRQKYISDRHSARSSWHGHIYRKPVKNPTPHSIADILGWESKTVVSYPTINVIAEESELQHLLKLNTNAVSEQVNYHQNYPMMPLNPAQQYTDFYCQMEDHTYSEDDENNASDQPLNLCIVRTSRESSPEGSQLTIQTENGNYKTEFLKLYN